jgi:hypothetical protein
MSSILNPKIKNTNNGNEPLGELPIRADEISATRYIEDKGLGSYDSFLSNNDNRFSNDGGQPYNYYVSGETYVDYWLNTGITYEWRTEFGYYPTIASIDYT